MKTNAQGSEKKPYQKPTLRIYGAVRKMTQTNRVQKGFADKFGGGRKTA